MRKSIVCFAIIFAISVMLSGCTPYQLSTSIVPNGGGTISPSNGTFKGGNDVLLVANPAQYYKFDGWAGDASGNTNPLTLKMNSDKQIVARFSKIQTNLQVKVTPSNSGTVNPSGGTFNAGTQLNVIATPSDGYRFNQWTGDITGNSNKSTLLMDANKTVTANFTKVYNLTITVPLNVGATVSPGSGIYDAGTKVTLTTKETMYQYKFDRWSGTDDDNVNPTTATMNSDKAVTLYFRDAIVLGPFTDTKTIWGGGSINATIEFKQHDWVQGEFWGPYITAALQDPNGTFLKNLGASFSFYAEIPGRYTVTLQNTNTLVAAAYKLTYNIYR